MPLVSKDQLRQDLKNGTLAPVYVLFGEETFLRDLAVKTIAEKTFAPGDFRDLNDTTFSLSTEDNLQRALAAADQIPMMAERRLIRITDVRISATGFRDTIKEAHEPALSAYFGSPSEHAVVMFIVEELNGVRKMGKLLREQAYAVNFEPLSDDELTAWARRTFAEAGASVTEPVLRRFMSRIGPDLQRLTNEISKLATAALPGTEITTDLVDSLVVDSREVSNFVFTDQLIAGRPAEALATLAKTLDDGAEPVLLLGSISFAYRRLLAIRDMLDRGQDSREVSRSVRLFGNQDAVIGAARKTPRAKLIHAVRSIAETDLALKTSAGGGGPAASRMLIQVLACRLATLTA